MKSVICIVLSSFLVDFVYKVPIMETEDLTTYHFTIALKVIILYFVGHGKGV